MISALVVAYLVARMVWRACAPAPKDPAAGRLVPRSGPTPAPIDRAHRDELRWREREAHLDAVDAAYRRDLAKARQRFEINHPELFA